MFPRSRVSPSSPRVAYQAVAVADDDDDKDGNQTANPGTARDEAIFDEMSDADADDLGVVLTEKDVRAPSPLHRSIPD